MNVKQKIAQSRKEISRDKKGKFNKKNDPFLLWGEYPHGWSIIKDLILCFMLFSFIINNAGKVDFSVLTTKKTLVIVTEAKEGDGKVQRPQEEKKTTHSAIYGQIDAIADLIWTRESSRGKNNYSKCELAGKINGIGYGIPGDGTYMCFDSHEEEMATLKKWIEKHIEEGMTETEIKCHYSGNNYIECLDKM